MGTVFGTVTKSPLVIPPHWSTGVQKSVPVSTRRTIDHEPCLYRFV